MRSGDPSNWINPAGFRESVALEIRFEAFNALNYAQFLNPNSVMTDTNFGRVTTAGAARQLQLRPGWSGRSSFLLIVRGILCLVSEPVFANSCTVMPRHVGDYSCSRI